MKKITLFMAILFTSLTYSQVTIGTGNDGGVLESPPLTSYYGFSYGQFIYLSSEINANGNITSVAFQLIAGVHKSKFTFVARKSILSHKSEFYTTCFNFVVQT